MVKNTEHVKTWKQAVMTYFKVISQHLPGETDYNHAKPQDNK